ncbi:MAG: hypothetical protein N3H84_02980 [Candidatus Caldarchaeum sp.]|nr:hypothetical protein [Candidatus Caldarchaeum sp.]MCX8201052.1 hypothetical protein [Candidatus Caldarchaeum sp.]MDW8434869.1 hypothetical protein [Candidatus Caldarchaeum sp.]
MDLKQILRSLYASAWVGWQVESNWTEPFVFIGLQIIRPLASTLLFPLLYIVGMNFTGTPVDSTYLTYVFVGTAFLTPYIFAAETGGTIVSQDRERYGVMKSIYITTSSLPTYFFGRFLAIAAISLVSTVFSFILSYLFIVHILGYSLLLTPTSIPNILAALIAIYVGSVAIFYLLPSINFLTNKLQWSLTYYFLGLLYLLGDILFPVESLSPWAAPLKYVLPINQALNSVRASFGLDIEANLTYAFLISSLWVTLSLAVFGGAVRRARAKGLLDKIGWW